MQPCDSSSAETDDTDTVFRRRAVFQVAKTRVFLRHLPTEERLLLMFAFSCSCSDSSQGIGKLGRFFLTPADG